MPHCFAAEFSTPVSSHSRARARGSPPAPPAPAPVPAFALPGPAHVSALHPPQSLSPVSAAASGTQHHGTPVRQSFRGGLDPTPHAASAGVTSALSAPKLRPAAASNVTAAPAPSLGATPTALVLTAPAVSLAAPGGPQSGSQGSGLTLRSGRRTPGGSSPKTDTDAHADADADALATPIATPPDSVANGGASTCAGTPATSRAVRGKSSGNSNAAEPSPGARPATATHQAHHAQYVQQGRPPLPPQQQAGGVHSQAGHAHAQSHSQGPGLSHGYGFGHGVFPPPAPSHAALTGSTPPTATPQYGAAYHHQQQHQQQQHWPSMTARGAAPTIEWPARPNDGALIAPRNPAALLAARGVRRSPRAFSGAGALGGNAADYAATATPTTAGPASLPPPSLSQQAMSLSGMGLALLPAGGLGSCPSAAARPAFGSATAPVAAMRMTDDDANAEGTHVRPCRSPKNSASSSSESATPTISASGNEYNVETAINSNVAAAVGWSRSLVALSPSESNFADMNGAAAAAAATAAAAEVPVPMVLLGRRLQQRSAAHLPAPQTPSQQSGSLRALTCTSTSGVLRRGSSNVSVAAVNAAAAAATAVGQAPMRSIKSGTRTFPTECSVSAVTAIVAPVAGTQSQPLPQPIAQMQDSEALVARPERRRLVWADVVKIEPAPVATESVPVLAQADGPGKSEITLALQSEQQRSQRQHAVGVITVIEPTMAQQPAAQLSTAADSTHAYAHSHTHDYARGNDAAARAHSGVSLHVENSSASSATTLKLPQRASPPGSASGGLGLGLGLGLPSMGLGMPLVGGNSGGIGGLGTLNLGLGIGGMGLGAGLGGGNSGIGGLGGLGGLRNAVQQHALPGLATGDYMSAPTPRAQQQQHQQQHQGRRGGHYGEHGAHAHYQAGSDFQAVHYRSPRNGALQRQHQHQQHDHSGHSHLQQSASTLLGRTDSLDNGHARGPAYNQSHNSFGYGEHVYLPHEQPPAPAGLGRFPRGRSRSDFDGTGASAGVGVRDPYYDATIAHTNSSRALSNGHAHGHSGNCNCGCGEPQSSARHGSYSAVYSNSGAHYANFGYGSGAAGASTSSRMRANDVGFSYSAQTASVFVAAAESAGSVPVLGDDGGSARQHLMLEAPSAAVAAAAAAAAAAATAAHLHGYSQPYRAAQHHYSDQLYSGSSSSGSSAIVSPHASLPAPGQVARTPHHSAVAVSRRAPTAQPRTKALIRKRGAAGPPSATSAAAGATPRLVVGARGSASTALGVKTVSAAAAANARSTGNPDMIAAAVAAAAAAASSGSLQHIKQEDDYSHERVHSHGFLASQPPLGIASLSGSSQASTALPRLPMPGQHHHQQARDVRVKREVGAAADNDNEEEEEESDDGVDNNSAQSAAAVGAAAGASAAAAAAGGRRGAAVECGVCRKQFSSKASLTRHARIHSDDRPYACQHCRKSFARQTDLQRHLRMHNPQRPFECGFCSKRFTTRANARVHERCHTGIKPYACEVCGETFAQVSARNNHLRTHTKERPFACACGKAFGQAATLKAHQQRKCLPECGPVNNVGRHRPYDDE